MVKTEFYKTRNDGVNLYRTYSDNNMYIERDGVLYTEAIDPEGTGRVYTETNTSFKSQEELAMEALSIITGGEV